MGGQCIAKFMLMRHIFTLKVHFEVIIKKSEHDDDSGAWRLKGQTQRRGASQSI